MGKLCTIKGGDVNTVTVLNLCKNALNMQDFISTDRMVSKVITKHLCNYRKSFSMSIYCLIFTIVFLGIFVSKFELFLFGGGGNF